MQLQRERMTWRDDKVAGSLGYPLSTTLVSKTHGMTDPHAMHASCHRSAASAPRNCRGSRILLVFWPFSAVYQDY
jgi:hypothetical protein